MFCIQRIKHMAAVSELDLNDLYSSIRSSINPISSIKTLLRWDLRGTSSVALKDTHCKYGSCYVTRFAFLMLVLLMQQKNNVKVQIVVFLWFALLNAALNAHVTFVFKYATLKYSVEVLKIYNFEVCILYIEPIDQPLMFISSIIHLTFAV